MKIQYLLFTVLFINLGCAQSSSKPITEVSQNELKNVVLIDVRTPKEFSAGHMENAINIDWFDKDFEQRFEQIGKEETIYVYCKMGGRSTKAQEKLKSMGYVDVINLAGGYDAYLKNKK